MTLYIDIDGSGKYVWIINRNGKLKQLFTPFRVLCIVSIPPFKANSQVYVEAVFERKDGKLYFLIFNKPYLHTHFIILSKL